MTVSTSAPNASAALEFDFKPHIRLIASTRAMLGELCSNVSIDPEATSRVTLAAHELLENVAKYCVGGKNTLEIELNRREGRCFVQIRTRNRAASAQLERLRELFSEMRDARDPIAYYDAAIARSVHSTGSGLGLARIRAEAEMTLALSVTGDEVTISAEAPLEKESLS